ncbi:serine hydrolase domain-containing protein [Azospirillum thermophilum]|uniref:Serine hydrolase n=1 Tax=Azospirillum thermophilum TaxID=2202148 RepID=A0A2S2CVB0_9PROT|nr:serine hydrolase domain-containing protein [Azospirillum thermophilum]AWK88416.1 serine hydrolase [Azospirillum thermophilum]
MRATATALMMAMTMAATMAAPTPAFSADPGLAARLDSVVDRAVAEQRIVGTVVLVAEDGRIVYRRAAGLADRESRRPMREDAVFRLASVSKPFVTVAALALAERGALRLDDPVTRFLPDFRPALPDGRRPEITVRHLLTHSAGLTYSFFEPPGGPYHQAGVSDGIDLPGFGLEENLRRIASAPLLYEPGRGWSYSVATDVLGAVVERAGGAPLPDMVERLVTGPLGLRDAGFTAREPDRLAVPYADGSPRPVRMTTLQEMPFAASTILYSPPRALDPTAFPSGGAGMVGTAGDVLALLEALRTGGGPVLSRDGVRALVANAVGDRELGLIPPGWRWGLGFPVLQDPAAAGTPQSAGTWQWGGVYGHSWFVDPARRLTVVALTNTAVAGMAGAFPDGIRDAVYGTGAR